MSEKEKRGDPKITEIVREYISLTNDCIVPQFFIFFLQFWCNKKKNYSNKLMYRQKNRKYLVGKEQLIKLECKIFEHQKNC